MGSRRWVAQHVERYGVGKVSCQAWGTCETRHPRRPTGEYAGEKRATHSAPGRLVSAAWRVGGQPTQVCRRSCIGSGLQPQHRLWRGSERMARVRLGSAGANQTLPPAHTVSTPPAVLHLPRSCACRAPHHPLSPASIAQLAATTAGPASRWRSACAPYSSAASSCCVVSARARSTSASSGPASPRLTAAVSVRTCDS